MEPGFLKPGNPSDVTDAQWKQLVASMEPGFLKPGNGLAPGLSLTEAEWLQWSQAS